MRQAPRHILPGCSSNYIFKKFSDLAVCMNGEIDIAKVMIKAPLLSKNEIIRQNATSKSHLIKRIINYFTNLILGLSDRDCKNPKGQ